MSIAIEGLTVSGKSGLVGPTACLADKSELEHAQLPSLEATTVLATKLRRRHAQVLKVSIREVVKKKRSFYGQADRKGGGDGEPPRP